MCCRERNSWWNTVLFVLSWMFLTGDENYFLILQILLWTIRKITLDLVIKAAEFHIKKSFKRSSGLMMSTVCLCEKESIVSTEDLILNLVSFYLQLCTLNTKAHSFAIRLSFPSWTTQVSLEQNTLPSSPKMHSSPSFLSYISQHSQAINKDRWRGK